MCPFCLAKILTGVILVGYRVCRSDGNDTRLPYLNQMEVNAQTPFSSLGRAYLAVGITRILTAIPLTKLRSLMGGKSKVAHSVHQLPHNKHHLN